MPLSADQGVGKIVPLPSVFVTDKGHIGKLIPFDLELKNISGLVMTCVSIEKKPQEICVCRHKDRVQILNEGYQSIITDHPDWEGKILSFKRPDQTNTSIILNMEALQKQIEQSLKCN